LLGLLILHVPYRLHVQFIYYMHKAPPNKHHPGRQQVVYESDRPAVSNTIQRWDSRHVMSWEVSGDRVTEH